MLKVLYEDNHVIVTLKEAGVLSQQDSSNDLDILRMVKEYIKNKYNKPGEAYIGLVHRLDRNTEGIMVFARTSKAASRLQNSMKSEGFNKKYLAVVEGKPKEGLIIDYLKKNDVENKSYVVDSKSGLESKLELKILETKKINGNIYSLVDIKLLTGRHHQIRCQLSNMGCPLYGDVKYNAKDKKGNYFALCSYMLEFEHPTLKERMIFKHFVPKGIFKDFYGGEDFMDKYKI